MNILSPWHLLLIGIVALLLFGNRLPEVARSMGRAINEFKKGLREVQDDIKSEPGQDLVKSEQPRQRLTSSGSDPVVSDKTSSSRPRETVSSQQDSTHE